MTYFIRTVLRSGIQARGATRYDGFDEALRAAGTQLKNGFAADAWIEDEDGKQVADASEIKRQCGMV